MGLSRTGEGERLQTVLGEEDLMPIALKFERDQRSDGGVVIRYKNRSHTPTFPDVFQLRRSRVFLVTPPLSADP